MTPKDKAEELYCKMLLTHSKRKYNGDRAIKGSLVAVEMLIEYADDGKVTAGRKGLSDLEYWQEVKTELEKL